MHMVVVCACAVKHLTAGMVGSHLVVTDCLTASPCTQAPVVHSCQTSKPASDLLLCCLLCLRLLLFDTQAQQALMHRPIKTNRIKIHRTLSCKDCHKRSWLGHGCWLQMESAASCLASRGTA